ncbi:tail fiber protein [Yersinia enterocolitica]|uniref:tail fiber protein n=1 Tax=Yersinia enterocolitica TaxID=630 RepID=UPI002155B22D|nr:tail fiber protein [Yersinia enterocolitica]
MAKNEILPFGIGVDANVLTPAEYEALAARIGGFSSGVAKSEQLNTVWRQAAFMASMLAQFIADNAEQDVIDDGKIAELQIKLESAIKSYANSNLPSASTTQKGVVQLSSATNSTSEALAATPKAVKAALDASLPVAGTAKAAEKLATARKIGGVDFDGTKDITLPFINTTDANVQLEGILGSKGLQVFPLAGSPEGGEINLYDKDNKRAAYIDIDSGGNFRVVTESLGVTLTINRATGIVSIPKALTAAKVTSAANVEAGSGNAFLQADGNIYGPVWGGYFSTYLSNRTEHRVRAWAAVQGSGTIISSFGFAAINRTNVGGYNFTMSTSNGAYAVTVGIGGGSQNGALSAHSANIWNRTPNSFSIQNANDSGSSYNWIDWPEFYVIVVGP